MDKSKIYWIAGGIFLTGVIGYFIYDYKKSGPQGIAPVDDFSTDILLPVKDAVISGISGLTSTSFPLKNGSKGSQVIVLQKYLNDKYGSKLTVDGIFGAKTEAAVKAMMAAPNNSAMNTFVNDGYFLPNGNPLQVTAGQISEAFYNKFIA